MHLGENKIVYTSSGFEFPASFMLAGNYFGTVEVICKYTPSLLNSLTAGRLVRSLRSRAKPRGSGHGRSRIYRHQRSCLLKAMPTRRIQSLSILPSPNSSIPDDRMGFKTWNKIIAILHQIKFIPPINSCSGGGRKSAGRSYLLKN